jgi:hypothetical protein
MVDGIVDATDMKYEDGSVGVFLMAAMSISSDWWTSLDDKEKDQAAEKFDKEADIARLEMGQAAAGILDPEKVTQAQRIKIFREVHRTLRKGGYFFTDGFIEEIAALQRLGFKLCAAVQYQEPDDDSRLIFYEFVVVKQ